MANELNIQLNRFTESGLSLLGRVKSLAGVQQGSDVNMTEPTSGQYTGTFDVSTLADGQYLVSFESTTVFYGSGVLNVEKGAEVTELSIGVDVIDIKAKTDQLTFTNPGEVDANCVSGGSDACNEY